MLMQPDQVAYLAALFFVGFVVDHWLAARRASAPRSLPIVKPLAAASIAGALIIAVPILLTVLFAESSDRAAFPYTEATRGSLHPASLLTLPGRRPVQPGLRGALLGPLQRCLGSAKRLFLSPNMSQLYAGALPMLAILIFGIGARPRLDARGALPFARRPRSRGLRARAATRRCSTSSTISCPA